MKELIKKLNLEDFFRIIKNDKFEYAGGFKGFPELKIGLLDSYLKFKKKDHSERDFRHDYFKNSDVDKLFEETSKIREDFLKLDKLRKDGYFKRRKENPWKSGRKAGIVESIETFMAKERSQTIKYLLEAGYPYKKISDMVNCGISLVQKVSKIRKQQKTKSDSNDNTKGYMF